jgi:3-dehydroquinate dehydratase
MKEFYSSTKTKSLRNKIDTFAQFLTETIVEALERFNEYMRAEFLEWHIDFLKRRMEKMEIEREAQDLKVVEARSTCEKCEECGHVQGKPRFNASSSIQDLFPIVHN